LNEMVMIFVSECICNCEIFPYHMPCSLKNPWRISGVLCSINHANLPVDIRGSERVTVTSRLPLVSDMPRVLFGSFALSFYVIFKVMTAFLN